MESNLISSKTELCFLRATKRVEWITSSNTDDFKMKAVHQFVLMSVWGGGQQLH